MTLDQMALMIARCLGEEDDTIAELISTLDGAEIIDMHNQLVSIDNSLRKRWIALGRPSPELLRL